jgi:hypothetical protein
MDLPYFQHPYYMRYLLSAIIILSTLTVHAQAPSIQNLVTICKAKDFMKIAAFADSLGYVKQKEIPQIGNMYNFTLTTFTRKDTSLPKSLIEYSSGHHYAMNQGPLSVSLIYSTSSAAEFDKLVAEIKALGAKEMDAKEDSPLHNYLYERITISSFENINTPELKYTIGLNCVYW